MTQGPLEQLWLDLQQRGWEVSHVLYTTQGNKTSLQHQLRVKRGQDEMTCVAPDLPPALLCIHTAACELDG